MRTPRTIRARAAWRQTRSSCDGRAREFWKLLPAATRLWRQLRRRQQEQEDLSLLQGEVLRRANGDVRPWGVPEAG